MTGKLRLALRINVIEAGMDKETKDNLHNKLIRLGDMMGDGLHHEPGGKWISREYRQTCIALGIIENPKRRNNSAAIDERMQQRVADVPCGECGGILRQTRSGSKRALCQSCGSKWALLK